MKKTAFLFPGQGSQAVGMGRDVYEELPSVREWFEMAEEVCKMHLSRICFQGPMEDLTQTVHLQPALTAVNLSYLIPIQAEGMRPDYTAGHSLGEYSALFSARVVSGEETIRMVHRRGELMHRESGRFEGAMHAVMGLPLETVQGIVEEVGKEGVVAVANHNAELQIVTTGTPALVEKVSAIAVEKGAKTVALKVSGPWHSPLMERAGDDFRAFLEAFSFGKAESPVVLNVTAEPATDPAHIHEVMKRQLTSPVRWYDAMRRLKEEGVEQFVEIGPGKVLAGLLKRILPRDYPCRIINVNSLKSLEQFLAEAAK